MPLAPDATWQERTRYITGMALVLALRMGSSPGSLRLARERVIGDARVALGETPGGEMIGEVVTDQGPMETINGPGMFRLVLVNTDLDYRDPRVAERFMIEVQRRIGELMADPDEIGRLSPGTPITG